jgi:hypothetical protein
MCRRVVRYVGSTVSEEHAASIFWVKDQSVDTYQTTRFCMPEDSSFYRHCYENLRSYVGKPEIMLQSSYENKLIFIEVGIQTCFTRYVLVYRMIV